MGLLYYSISEVNDRMHDVASDLQDSLSTSENMSVMIQNTFGAVKDSYENLKWISVVLIIALFLSVIIHSFLVNTRPIFWISYLLLWILCYIIAVPLANVYEEIYLNPELVEAFSGFVGQNFLMLHLPTLVLVIGFIAGVVLFINFVRTRETL